MGIKKYNCITSSTRFKSVNTFENLTEKKPFKRLTKGKTRISGRGDKGKISVRRRGGGSKRLYRLICFNRRKKSFGKIKSIQYDPNRSAFISLVSYVDGSYGYVLFTDRTKVGDIVQSGSNSPIKEGNSLPLKNIPIGTNVHNVEMSIGKGGVFARSAGSFCVITAKDAGYVFLKMPSTEVRKIREECYATIGVCGNKEHNLVSLGKAGRARWKGKRPKVRGVVMNPIDHPHGGGEGKSSGGRHPVTPWGKSTKGYKTRSKKNKSDKFIVQSRKKR